MGRGRLFFEFAGISAMRVAVVPAAQQFAEKIHAFTFPWSDRDNARVKDLVDLVLLVHSGLLKVTEVEQALETTFRTRTTHSLQAELPKPPKIWSESFRSLAIDLELPVQDLEQAYAYLEAFWRGHGLGQVEESGGEEQPQNLPCRAFGKEG
jgi:hypothetical protein